MHESMTQFEVDQTFWDHSVGVGDWGVNICLTHLNELLARTPPPLIILSSQNVANFIFQWSEGPLALVLVTQLTSHMFISHTS